MYKLIPLALVVWAGSIGLSKAYSMALDVKPLPIELQDTCMTGHGFCQDPEEVCINGQCEAEQD